MGFSKSWIAVRGMPASAIHEVLGVRATGEREEVPDSPLVGTVLPSLWYLVVSDSINGPFMNGQALARLSSTGDVVTCQVEEHVMYSAATGWKHGRRAWTVIHDARKSVDHLAGTGDLPPEFLAIRDRLVAAQREEAANESMHVPGYMSCDHIFDIPVTLAAELTGYRLDEVIEDMTGDVFEVLA